MAKQILSNCCQSEIITGTVHICSKCEQECCEEEYSKCDYCGEIDADLNDQGYCADCVLEIV